MKVSSAVWLAGSEVSVLRRNDIVILNCGRNFDVGADGDIGLLVAGGH